MVNDELSSKNGNYNVRFYFKYLILEIIRTYPALFVFDEPIPLLFNDK